MISWRLSTRAIVLAGTAGFLVATCAVTQLRGARNKALTDRLSLASPRLPAVQLFAELERQVGLRVISAVPGDQVIEVGESPTAASILQAIADYAGWDWVLEGRTAVIGGDLWQPQGQQERAKKRAARRRRLVDFLESLPEGVRARVEAGHPLCGKDIRSLPAEAQHRLHELLTADLGGYNETTHLADNDAVTVILCPQVLFLREGQAAPVDALRLFPKVYFQDVCKP